MRRPWLVPTLCVLLLSVGCGRRDAPATAGGGKPPLHVAAAADLTSAFGEIGAAYEKQTGQKVVFSFGSTGLLAKQISEGAPFDLFAAANVEFVDEVVKDGTCLSDSKTRYARGRVVLWARNGSDLPAKLEDLADPRFAKVAIANPEHAPYGRAAKEALEKAGVWERVKPKMVYGENVRQTMQFAETGNADVAIVALSLAVLSSTGRFSPIDPDLHAPLEQALVVCRGGPDAKGSQEADARAFAAFVGSPAGRAVMKRYGFLLPGESLSTREKP